ncbi:MAG: ATP-binding protein [Phycisphaerales bacterium]|nr:MAG: ATP-binding protein [Phycisphaerales bacterium]
MPIDKPFGSTVEESDLRRLIRAERAADRTIDYEEDLSLDRAGQKEGFLKHVGSFANSLGGDVIYGIRKEGGLPVELCGVEVDNFEALKQELESLVRDCTEPPVEGVEIGCVRLSESSRAAIVVRVPRSHYPPHMVKTGSIGAIYGRSAAGADPLDVAQLRQLFLLSETSVKQVRDFCAERISLIVGNETPVKLHYKPRIVVHVVPFGAFARGRMYDLSVLDGAEAKLPNIQYGVARGWYNLEGYYTCSPAEPPVLSYTQAFRNGIIEAVYNHHAEGLTEPELVGRQIHVSYEKRVSDSVSELAAVQQMLGVEPPIFVVLSLVGVRGCKLAREFDSPEHDIDGARIFERDVLSLPEVMLERFDCDVDSRMRPVFDIVRNAAGLEPKQR